MIGGGAPQRAATCFQEADPTLPLLRRASAECLGTLLLMLIVTTSNSALPAAFPNQPEALILGGALAAPAALVGLVIAFGALSGGHFNPLITLLQWLSRERTTRCTFAYVAAQVLGAVLGAQLAGFLTGSAPAHPSSAASWSLMPSEIIATAGLLAIVFGCARSGRADTGPLAVGTWLVAIGITIPTAIMNPALLLGASTALGPVALGAPAVLRYLPSQCVGALLALACVRLTYGATGARREFAA